MASITGMGKPYSNEYDCFYTSENKEEEKKSDKVSLFLPEDQAMNRNQSSNWGEGIAINIDPLRNDEMYQPVPQTRGQADTTANNASSTSNQMNQINDELTNLNKKLDLLLEAHRQHEKAEVPAPRTVSSTIKGVANGIFTSTKWFAYSSIPTYLFQAHRLAHSHARTAALTSMVPYAERYWPALVKNLYEDSFTLKMFSVEYLNPLKLLPESFSPISNFLTPTVVWNSSIKWLIPKNGELMKTISGLYDFVIVPITQLDSTTKVAITALVVIPTALIVWKRMGSRKEVVAEPIDLEQGHI